MEKTFLLLVMLLPMCSFLFQKIIKKPMFCVRTQENSIFKNEQIRHVKRNKL
ncbi:hypothetical protein FEM08_34610 [Flavobacterium gilvum]|nr:hypothetical protein FEM08_34610 [Flavobacterium gilvum]